MKDIFNRRKFIKSSAVLSSVAYVGCKSNTAVKSAISSRGSELEAKASERVRYSLTHPTHGKNLALTYGQAIKIMSQAKEGQTSRWEQWANIHEEFSPHGNWFFLPWHRAYLFYFEEDIRSVLATIPLEERLPEVPEQYYTNWTLPYWDWETIPEYMFIENDKIMLTPAVDKRDVDEKSEPPQQTFAKQKCLNILEKQSFHKFGSQPSDKLRGGKGGGFGELEGTPHNIGHGWVGGVMGTYMSPMDPIFWLHHCNVDRFWALWTAKRISEGKTLDETLPPGDPKFPQELWLNTPLGNFLSGNKKDATMTAADVVDLEKGLTRFTYDEFVERNQTTISLTENVQFKTPTRTSMPTKLPVEETIASFEGSEGLSDQTTHFMGKVSFKNSVTADWNSPEVKSFVEGVYNQYRNGELHNKTLELIISDVRVPMSQMLRNKGLMLNIAWNDPQSSGIGQAKLAPFGFFMDPGVEYGGNPNIRHANHAHGIDIRFDLEPMIIQTRSASELLNVLRTVLTVEGRLFQFNSNNQFETITTNTVDTGRLVETADRMITGPVLSGLVASLIKYSNVFLVMSEVK